MKQKYKNLSTSCDTSLVLMTCLKSREFWGVLNLSSLRSSFQLHAIKNRTRETINNVIDLKYIKMIGLQDFY